MSRVPKAVCILAAVALIDQAKAAAEEDGLERYPLERASREAQLEAAKRLRDALDAELTEDEVDVEDAVNVLGRKRSFLGGKNPHEREVGFAVADRLETAIRTFAARPPAEQPAPAKKGKGKGKGGDAEDE